MSAPAPILSEEIAAFLQRGVSLVVASRDAQLLPSLARAYGCHVSPDRRRVTVVLSARQSGALLAAIADSGQIALAVTEPATHLSYQLKGNDAQIRPLQPFDHASCDKHVEDFVIDVSPLGYPEPLLRAVMGTAVDDRVAVSFTPAQSFDQTPGSSAGTRLA